MSRALEVVEATFRITGTDDVEQPVRTVVRVPGKSAVLGSMPAHVGPARGGAYGVKVVVVDPTNAMRGLDTHLGLVTSFDAETGQPVAVVEAGAVTAIRTAAASAVATRTLAGTLDGHVAVIGAGVQAQLHLEAMHAVMLVRGATIWSRRPEAAAELAERATATYPFPVEAAPTVRAATKEADVICTVTSSTCPILSLADVRPGTHVNAVGACFPDSRELSSDLIGASRVVVDVLDAARVEAGDLLLAESEGVHSLNGAAELGAILRGSPGGRVDAAEITLFESLGFAALDVATAIWVAAEADRRGLGTAVNLH
jgi:alanine dehydrogenase